MRKKISKKEKGDYLVIIAIIVIIVTIFLVIGYSNKLKDVGKDMDVTKHNILNNMITQEEIK